VAYLGYTRKLPTSERCEILGFGVLLVKSKNKITPLPVEPVGYVGKGVFGVWFVGRLGEWFVASSTVAGAVGWCEWAGRVTWYYVIGGKRVAFYPSFTA